METIKIIYQDRLWEIQGEIAERFNLVDDQVIKTEAQWWKIQCADVERLLLICKTFIQQRN